MTGTKKTEIINNIQDITPPPRLFGRHFSRPLSRVLTTAALLSGLAVFSTAISPTFSSATAQSPVLAPALASSAAASADIWGSGDQWGNDGWNGTTNDIFSGASGNSNEYLYGAAGLSQGCGAAFATFGSHFGGGLPVGNLSGRAMQALPVAMPGSVGNFLDGQIQGGLGNLQSSLCSSLTGGNFSLGGGDLFGQAKSALALSLLDAGTSAAQGTGLPFLGRLEVDSGYSASNPYWQVLSVQPLFHDGLSQNRFFTQVSWNRSYTEELIGKAFRDTMNAGLAWRRLNTEETLLYGLNAFFDHNLDYHHNRVSIGADVQTTLLGASFNRYIPLTDWKSVNSLTEERAVAGMDLELRGQIPQLPALTAYVKGYQWKGYDDVSDIHGLDTRLEWAPVQGLRIAAGAIKESGESWDMQVGMRVLYNFGRGMDFHLAPVTALASVRDRSYDRVWRDNSIRVQQRQKLSAQLTVTATSGANTSSGGALSAGQRLNLPQTITVAGSAGAMAVLTLANGGTLTLGQNTQVEIESTLVTLVSGTMQYVSGSTDVTVNVPGGTVTLLGTDIDVVASGATATVRVRDGAVTVAGNNSGSATIAAASMVQVANGAVSTVTTGSPAYQAHGIQVSELIDRVAPKRDETKYAPYPIRAPYLLTQGAQVGETSTIGVKFSKAVTVSGTPTLALLVNGNPQTAAYSGGAGTDELVFSYIHQPGDAGAGLITAQSLSGDISANGQPAVLTMADTVLPLDGIIETLFTVTWTQTTITPSTGAIFTLSANTAAGATYSYTLTDSASTTTAAVTGAITATSQNITVPAATLATLADGQLTVDVTVTQGTAISQPQSAAATKQDCDAINESCFDGSILAGIIPAGWNSQNAGKKLYVAADESYSAGAISFPWGTSTVQNDYVDIPTMTNCTSWNTPGNVGCADGAANTAAMAAISTYPGPYRSANACVDETQHGKNDWYLPSILELDMVYANLYENQPEGSKLNLGSTAVYHSSSENSALSGWRIYVVDSGRYANTKGNHRRARCVRAA